MRNFEFPFQENGLKYPGIEAYLQGHRKLWSTCSALPQDFAIMTKSVLFVSECVYLEPLAMSKNALGFPCTSGLLPAAILIN